MPGLASILHSMRRTVAGWLLPEIEDLLLQRINEEKNDGGDPSANSPLRAGEAAAAFSALRQPPPEDWLARVREGAPQLLVTEDAGSIPPIRLDKVEEREASIVVSSQRPDQALHGQARPDQPPDIGEVGHMNLSNRQSSGKRASEAMVESTDDRNASMPADYAGPATGLSDTALPRPRALRERVARALHAATRAISGKQSQWLNQVAFGMEKNEPAPRARVERRTQPENWGQRVRSAQRLAELLTDNMRQSRTRPLAEDAELSAALTQSARQARYSQVDSQRDLLSVPVPPPVTRDDRVVTPAIAMRSNQDGHLPEESIRVSAPFALSDKLVEPRQEFANQQQRITDRNLDQLLSTPPHRARRLQEVPEEILRTAYAGPEVSRDTSYDSSAMRRPVVADRSRGERQTRPNRWPALMAQPRKRESVIESSQTQQHQARLWREQAVD